jgi:outer membrane receptor for ferrienterochelin and colicins
MRTEFSKIIRRVALAIIGLIAPACSAQSFEPLDRSVSPHAADMSLEQLLEMRVFTASRREQKTWEAPASVSIVTRDEIKSFGYRSLADVLRGVPGLYTSNDRNYTYLGIRGFSRPGDYNSRVLLLIDGHRANDNIYDSALLAQEALVEVDSIERVEVIRGPSSSLYGSSAFLGVINVITRRGASLNGVEFSGEGGTFDTYKGRASIGHKFKSGVEYFVSGSYYDSRGDDRLYYREFDNPSSNHGVAEDLDGERAGHFLGNITYYDFTLSAGLNSRVKNVPTAAFGGVFNNPKVETLDRAGYVDLKYSHEFANELQLTARVNYHRYDYQGAYYYDSAEPGNPPSLVLNKDDVRGEWWGSEIMAIKRFFEPLTVTGGAEFRHNFRQDQANFDEGSPKTIYVNDHSSSYIVGVFGQADLAIRTNLIFSAGLRYDYYSTFGDSVNPRLGLMYQPWMPTTFKLLYGRAFRAPNAYELNYVAPSYVANPDLDPEKIDTTEIVWEQTLCEKWKLSTSAFYYDVDGLVSLASSGSQLTFRNLNNAQAYGTELALEGRWADGWLGRMSYTAQRAEDSDTGDELSNSPRQLAKFQLRVPLIQNQLFAGAEVQYVGSVQAVQGGRVNDYWVANLTLLSRELVKGLEISASLYNLFDTGYAVTGSEEHLQRVLPQDGRSLRVKLTYNF